MVLGTEAMIERGCGPVRRENSNNKGLHVSVPIPDPGGYSHGVHLSPYCFPQRSHPGLTDNLQNRRCFNHKTRLPPCQNQDKFFYQYAGGNPPNIQRR